VSLFGGESGGGDALGLPDFPDVNPWTPLDKLAHEFGAVGFYLSAHPLDTRMEQFERLKISNYTAVERKMQSHAATSVQMAGIVLKKQERVSQKGNKFAFVQLSDPTGVYEVMLWSEILNASRDLLVPGNALLLKATAESREDQISFKAEKISMLEDALESKIETITIHTKKGACVHKLKDCLDKEGKGRSRITMFVHLDDGREVEMAIPGYWTLSADSRNDIRMEQGVQRILES